LSPAIFTWMNTKPQHQRCYSPNFKDHLIFVSALGGIFPLCLGKQAVTVRVPVYID